jgi:carboxyl-terminal processing protease
MTVVRVQSRVAAVLFAGVAACAAGTALHGVRASQPANAFETREPNASPPELSSGELVELTEEPTPNCTLRKLKLPSGQPARVSCLQARRVAAQVRARIAVAGGHPAPAEFAEAVCGWLDPHGLWSAPPDSPAAVLIRERATALIEDIERPLADESPCFAAVAVATVIKRWVEELRQVFEAARRRTSPTSKRRAFELVSDGVFEDDPVRRPALTLTRSLAERIAAFEAHFSDSDPGPTKTAAERFLPVQSAERWSELVMAAVLRAYVSALDAHGQWAPLDEEWSLYTADAALDGGPRLWGRMVRTALGLRLISQAQPPLRNGDLVLSVAGILTAGLSVEQLEQLTRLEPVGDETVRDVVVLRSGSQRLLRVPIESRDAPTRGGAIEPEKLRYGASSVLVVPIADVPDTLGEELAALIATSAEPDDVAGILLDLRGNGGGSTDGAAGAIGVFLPGVPSFPLLRRGGSIEVQRAMVPTPAGQWRGPVAALVDGYTASAAEMIAGAIQSYGRGVLIGTRTFGKGCIQEYFDDRSGDGVLRLTTMLFSLPDGAPLQGVGLTPSLALSLPIPAEREATLAGTPPAWRGPDIRSASTIGARPWPLHHGKLGICSDPQVCAALTRLGADAKQSASQATQRRRTESINSARSQGFAKIRSAPSTLPDAASAVTTSQRGLTEPAINSSKTAASSESSSKTSLTSTLSDLPFKMSRPVKRPPDRNTSNPSRRSSEASARRTAGSASMTSTR